MAVKYRVEYTSVNDIDYTIDISNDTYAGAVISVVGSAKYGMTSVESLSHPIRSKYLRLNLLATTAQDLDDLFSSNDREWKVELYRDVDKIFFGYLSTEGAQQSYVTEERFVEFDALDPMAFLEDLAYVQSGGTKYTGYRSIIQTLSGALSRGFEDSADRFDFRTTAQISTEAGEVEDFFVDTTIEQSNFFDFESDESVSCIQVVEELLAAFNLCITQVNGSTWLIGHSMYDNNNATAYYINSYTADGALKADIAGTFNNTVELEQHDNTNVDTGVLHANENQAYFYKRGLKKIFYDNKFKYKQFLSENPLLTGGTTGVSMPDWTFNATWADPNAAGYFVIERSDSDANNRTIAITNTETSVFTPKDRLKLKGSFMVDYPAWETGGALSLTIQPTLVISLKVNSTAGPGFYNETISIQGVEDQTVNFEYELPPLDTDSTYEISVLNIDFGFETGATQTIYDLGIYGVDDVLIGNTANCTADVEKSLKSERKEVAYDLQDSTTMANQFYFVTTEATVTNIFDFFMGKLFFSLPELKGTADLWQQRKRIIFSGDFWSFYEPSDLISIPALSSQLFIPIDYEFDTYRNIGSARYEELFNDEIATTVTIDGIYSETIKPTIE